MLRELKPLRSRKSQSELQEKTHIAVTVQAQEQPGKLSSGHRWHPDTFLKLHDMRALRYHLPSAYARPPFCFLSWTAEERGASEAVGMGRLEVLCVITRLFSNKVTIPAARCLPQEWDCWVIAARLNATLHAKGWRGWRGSKKTHYQISNVI